MAQDAEPLLLLAEEAAVAEGCELVDLENVKEGPDRVLRLFADHPDGMGLDRCAALSERFSGLLDLHDPVAGAYRLEVSSPGVNRRLRKREDFTRFAGQRVRIGTFSPVAFGPDGAQRAKAFIGLLRGLEGEEILIEMEPDATLARIPWALVGKANLEFEFKKA